MADAEFPATARGYEQLLSWLRSFGRLWAVGVEGTGSYGAGLARHLTEQGVRVVEVNRPDRRQRRAQGKSDALDAYAAADAVLSGRACATPKLGTGIVEAIRALHITRAGAVKARTAAMNELRSLLVTPRPRYATSCEDSLRSRWCEPARGCAPPATPPTPGRGPRRSTCPGAPPPGAHRRDRRPRHPTIPDRVVYYQFRHDRARRTLRGIDEQSPKPSAPLTGTPRSNATATSDCPVPPSR